MTSNPRRVLIESASDGAGPKRLGQPRIDCDRPCTPSERNPGAEVLREELALQCLQAGQFSFTSGPMRFVLLEYQQVQELELHGHMVRQLLEFVIDVEAPFFVQILHGHRRIFAR